MRRDVLDKGYVELVESMGGDYSVVRNARKCYRSSSEDPEKNMRLILQLIDSGHMTPFESIVITYDVKCPLFIARQWMRHRIGSYNEESLRYCEAEPEFWAPKDQEWMLDDAMNQFTKYNALIKTGTIPEQARAILPMSLYTKFYWTVNGSSLINFLRLRTHKAAQQEIREYAKAVLELACHTAPTTFGYIVGECL